MKNASYACCFAIAAAMCFCAPQQSFAADDEPMIFPGLNPVPSAPAPAASTPVTPASPDADRAPPAELSVMPPADATAPATTESTAPDAGAPSVPHDPGMLVPLTSPGASVPAAGAGSNATSSALADTGTAGAAVDPSLTTYTAAVECATAQLVEQRRSINNPLGSAFKAGLCTGKVQSYMLRAREENPSCFPKISLEEGISMFVKWSDAHPLEHDTPYLIGLRKAFEDAVPCLKK